LALDEPTDKDQVFAVNEMKYVVETELMAKAGEISIDFVDMGYQKGFSVTPLQALTEGPEGSGCGSTCKC
jgi:Fe-S cluster assembly iron-binding protein IscA